MSRTWSSTITIYCAGVLQGCAFVLIPALGKVLKAAPYGLSAGSYGALFLPEIGGAIAAALLAGPLDRHVGSHGVFRLGLACNAAAVALLAASALFAGHAAAYALLLAETLLLGLGFGFIQSVINGFAVALYPRAATMAMTVLNAAIGGSTALSPLVVDGLRALGGWWLWPGVLAAGFLGTLIASVFTTLPGGNRNRAEALARYGPALLFIAAVLAYAIVEGTFSSWAVVYLTGVHHAAGAFGSAALASFWAAMTLLRLALSQVPPRWVTPRVFYLLSPPAMAACFVAVAVAGSGPVLVGLFAAAGAACGIFYPFSMSFALAAYPRSGTRIAGFLVAALMVGEGIGSYLPGGLQHWLPLAGIYGGSALWCVPLLALAWLASGRRGSGPG